VPTGEVQVEVHVPVAVAAVVDKEVGVKLTGIRDPEGGDNDNSILDKRPSSVAPTVNVIGSLFIMLLEDKFKEVTVGLVNPVTVKLDVTVEETASPLLLYTLHV
jgi:hypothetical protein